MSTITSLLKPKFFLWRKILFRFVNRSKLLEVLSGNAVYGKAIQNAKYLNLLQIKQLFSPSIQADFFFQFSPIALMIIAFDTFNLCRGNRKIKYHVHTKMWRPKPYHLPLPFQSFWESRDASYDSGHKTVIYSKEKSILLFLLVF